MTDTYPCRDRSCGHLDCIADRAKPPRCRRCGRSIRRADVVIAGARATSPKVFHPDCAPAGGVGVRIVADAAPVAGSGSGRSPSRAAR